METCPICDSKLIRKEMILKCHNRFTGEIIEIKLPGEYCEKCNEGFHSHEDLQAMKPYNYLIRSKSLIIDSE